MLKQIFNHVISTHLKNSQMRSFPQNRGENKKLFETTNHFKDEAAAKQ